MRRFSTTLSFSVDDDDTLFFVIAENFIDFAFLEVSHLYLHHVIIVHTHAHIGIHTHTRIHEIL